MKGLFACGETSCNGVHGKNHSGQQFTAGVLCLPEGRPMICCLVRPRIRQAEPDLKRYEDKEYCLEDYHQIVLEGIERMRGNE